MSLTVPRVPFGIGPLDLATLGGFPLGRSVLVYAKPKTGKTTVCYHAMASFQEWDKESEVAIFAQEDKHDEEYATNIGVDTSRVVVNPIDYAEITLDLILDIARDIKEYGNIGFVFVDSLRNLPAQQRIEESLAKSDFGIEAKVINKFYTELSVLQAKRRAAGKPLTVFCTNHETEGHSTVPNAPPPIVISRGKQQLYGSSLRIRLRNPKYIGTLTIGGITVPFQLDCKFIVEANLGGMSKMEGEYRLQQAPFQNMLPGEIDQVDFWWNQARNIGYITGAGKSWDLNNEDPQHFSSKVELLDFWRNNKKIYKQDRKNILPIAIQFFKDACSSYSKPKKGDDE